MILKHFVEECCAGLVFLVLWLCLMDGDAYAVIILAEEGIACKLSVFAEECAVNFVVFCVPRLDAAEDFFSVDAGLDALIGFVCLDKYGVDLFAEICWVELADEKISVALSDLVSSIVAQVPDSMVMNGCKVRKFMGVVAGMAE